VTIRGNTVSMVTIHRPTPCALFEWLVGAINYDLSRLTFVDYGAGKAACCCRLTHPSSVRGIEFAEELLTTRS
jgi:hypothetical protein